MSKHRLEAFSDGVIAILITIMVLELRAPHGADWEALTPLVPTFMAYVLSFVYLGIYWNNHHHMFQVAERVNGRILWANMHLLFWLSLVPFATDWMGESHVAALPVSLYGFVLLMAAVGYTVLQATIISHQGAGSKLRTFVGNDRKGKISLLAYAIAIPLAFVHTGISIALYVCVALLWLVPDSRIESRLEA